jgi:4,5-dihydroxyphthalate decarboxylase
VESDHPDVKPLIPNAREAGFEALQKRGHYPINHCIVVKDELLEARPELAQDIFDAFSQAKKVYVSLLREGVLPKPTAMDEMHKRVMEITGRDPLPYGIGANRQALEELAQAALDQGIISRRPNVEDLFPRGAAALVG